MFAVWAVSGYARRAVWPVIARLVRKALCRVFGHAYRHVYRQVECRARTGHPGEWHCRRCGFSPYVFEVDRADGAIVFLEDRRR